MIELNKDCVRDLLLFAEDTQCQTAEIRFTKNDPIPLTEKYSFAEISKTLRYLTSEPREIAGYVLGSEVGNYTCCIQGLTPKGAKHLIAMR